MLKNSITDLWKKIQNKQAKKTFDVVKQYTFSEYWLTDWLKERKCYFMYFVYVATCPVSVICDSLLSLVQIVHNSGATILNLPWFQITGCISADVYFMYYLINESCNVHTGSIIKMTPACCCFLLPCCFVVKRFFFLQITRYPSLITGPNQTKFWSVLRSHPSVTTPASLSFYPGLHTGGQGAVLTIETFF